MKLSEIPKGTRAIKPVKFRLANAPVAEDGQEDEHTVTTGARVLTGTETAQVYQEAQAAAKADGQTEWLDTHPLCRLYEMAHTVALAYVDNDARDEPFFASAEEVLSSPLIGADNIAYLYHQHQIWQDECSFRADKYKPEEVVALIAEEAERPENSPNSPFSRLRPSSQESLWHSTCVLFQSLLMARFATGTTTEQSLSSSPKSDAKPSPGTE